MPGNEVFYVVRSSPPSPQMAGHLQTVCECGITLESV